MTVLPLKPRLEIFLKRRNLLSQYEKQKTLFELNPRHPSLHTERLEPSVFNICSFRINKKFRALFAYQNNETVEVIDINNHYR